MLIVNNDSSQKLSRNITVPKSRDHLYPPLKTVSFILVQYMNLLQKLLTIL